MKVTNSEVSKLLRNIAVYLEMDDVQFKPRAYEKAADAVSDLIKEISDIYKDGGIKALEEIEGVGVSIAEKIEEFIKTGKIGYYEELKKKIPVDLDSLFRVDGIGPKTIKRLYKELGIKNLIDLEKAAKQNKIRGLKDFGEKSEENILKSIEFIKLSHGKFLRWQAEGIVGEIIEKISEIKGVKRVDVCGSIRRKKETIGDGDILAIAGNSKDVMEYFVNMADVARINAYGETKSSVKLKNGMDVDLRVVSGDSYAAALNYFTGSKEHNVRLREIAIKKGMKLNEYGLYKKVKNLKDKKLKDGEEWEKIAGKDERDIYKKLGLQYIEPEMREDRGEVELAQAHKLPKLIGYGDLKGDLQIQTDWSDGANTIEEYIEAGMGLGLEYILITDHTKHLSVARGLDEKRLLEQIKEIDRINKKLKAEGKNFRVLKGSEVDILKDGLLDISDDVLEKLDVVGAAVHSYFNLSEGEQTERMVKAMENRNVDIIFHPTGRILNKRPAYKIDMEKIIGCAKKTKTVLEVDAFPDRLDLDDKHIKMCVEAGVKISIDTDAHNISHLEFLKYGIAQARRGWAAKADIINAWPVDKMLDMLK